MAHHIAYGVHSRLLTGIRKNTEIRRDFFHRSTIPTVIFELPFTFIDTNLCTSTYGGHVIHIPGEGSWEVTKSDGFVMHI